MISESLIYEGGHTKLVLCDNLEGQGAEGGGWEGGSGTHTYLWLIHTDAWQRASQYCTATIVQLK